MKSTWSSEFAAELNVVHILKKTKTIKSIISKLIIQATSCSLCLSFIVLTFEFTEMSIHCSEKHPGGVTVDSHTLKMCL